LGLSSTLKTEATLSPETLVIFWATWRYNAENRPAS
jgi:hypothetical protein